jgi:hypothetical protein
MKFTMLAATAIGLLAATPGLSADRTYDLPPFTAIDISSGVDAMVTVGGTQSISATARNAADLDDLTVEVVDGTLKVGRDWDILDIFEAFSDRDIRFTIAAPSLISAVASSGADVDVSGLSGDSVRIEASSGADLKSTDMRATSITVEISSGSDLEANGTCTTLDVRISSGADADLDELVCTDVTIDASSGSDASVHASGSLKASASSGAEIAVHGKPATTDIQESSGGGVDLED